MYRTSLTGAYLQDYIKWNDQCSDLLVSHTVPVYPGAQVHAKASTRSVHVPPFRHGSLAHSFMSAKFKKDLKFSGLFIFVHSSNQATRVFTYRLRLPRYCNSQHRWMFCCQQYGKKKTVINLMVSRKRNWRKATTMRVQDPGKPTMGHFFRHFVLMWTLRSEYSVEGCCQM